MQKTSILLLLLSSPLLASCSAPWSTPTVNTLKIDLLEASFPEDLQWIENYGKQEYSIEDLQRVKGEQPHWIRFTHPFLPIRFAYPKNARLQVKEFDLNPEDQAIDIIINPQTGEKITVIFQTDLENPSHIANNGHYEVHIGGLVGTYYKARNMNGSKVSLEKFIAKIPNSRYGIHVTGNGDTFHTFINTLELR